MTNREFANLKLYGMKAPGEYAAALSDSHILSELQRLVSSPPHTPSGRMYRILNQERSRRFADKMTNATPEQIAQALERCGTGALEFGVQFEALGHAEPRADASAAVKQSYDAAVQKADEALTADEVYHTAMQAAGIEQHPYKGRTDRRCDVCGEPDRSPIHKRPDHSAGDVPYEHSRVKNNHALYSVSNQQITCLCGWTSGASEYMERIGQEFDSHMREEGVLKP